MALSSAAWSTTIVVSTIPATQQCCGEAIGFGDPNVKLQPAIRFVPSGTYSLDAVTFDLVSSFGSGLIVAEIYSESEGLPGDLLFSATAAGPAPSAGGLFTISPGSVFVLQDATAYWLTAVNTSTDSQSYWWYSDQSGWRAARDIPGRPSVGFPDWGNANGGGPAGPGTNQSLVLSFEITGTPTPEPATFLFISLGLVALTISRRGRLYR
jgi:hypothetical protein